MNRKKLYHNFNYLLGARIKHFRALKGMTLDDVNVELGLCRSALSNIENGKQNVNARDISILAKILEVSVDDLLDIGVSADLDVSENVKRAKEKKKKRIQSQIESLKKEMRSL